MFFISFAPGTELNSSIPAVQSARKSFQPQTNWKEIPVCDFEIILRVLVAVRYNFVSRNGIEEILQLISDSISSQSEPEHFRSYWLHSFIGFSFSYDLTAATKRSPAKTAGFAKKAKAIRKYFNMCIAEMPFLSRIRFSTLLIFSSPGPSSLPL